MITPDTVAPWPLVGRDPELAAFEAAWAARRCQGVVVHGPAGIGKSRLAEECLARALRDGIEGGGPPPRRPRPPCRSAPSRT